MVKFDYFSLLYYVVGMGYSLPVLLYFMILLLRLSILFDKFIVVGCICFFLIKLD